MNIEKITLDELLRHPNIHHLIVDGTHYFSYHDLNAVYDQGFKYTDTKALIVVLESGKKTLRKFVKFDKINEQVDHLKTMPSFGSRIDRLFPDKDK
jgi:hypothetical protein